MEMIPSFKIDHTRLNRGIYVSRVDTIGKEFVTTFDIRVRKPYSQSPMTADTIHTMEHLGATYLRNSERAEEVIYFGPMGCQTGFYLIMKGNLKPSDVVGLVKDMFMDISRFYGHIPGASREECGNYLLQNIHVAKLISCDFAQEIEKMDESNFTYPV